MDVEGFPVTCQKHNKTSQPQERSTLLDKFPDVKVFFDDFTEIATPKRRACSRHRNEPSEMQKQIKRAPVGQNLHSSVVQGFVALNCRKRQNCLKFQL